MYVWIPGNNTGDQMAKKVVISKPIHEINKNAWYTE